MYDGTPQGEWADGSTAYSKENPGGCARGRGQGGEVGVGEVGPGVD